MDNQLIFITILFLVLILQFFFNVCALKKVYMEANNEYYNKYT